VSTTNSEGFLFTPAPVPAYRLSNLPAAFAAAEAEEAPKPVCTHRLTYLAAGRRYCKVCGGKVADEGTEA
jgi:hypothetical protein